MSAALALQKALRARLTADPGLTALVPPANVIDSHNRPERFPCVILGEDQEVAEDITFEREQIRVTATLHVWHRETGLTGVKAISGAIRSAIRSEPLFLGMALDGWELIDLRFEGARFLRDPDGLTSHGVVTLEALIEVAQ